MNHIPDPIERGEASAERAYDEMMQPDGKMKCFCGALFDPETEGGLTSSNPYDMPVCPKCFDEAFSDDLRTMTPRCQAMHDAFAPTSTPESAYQEALNLARQLELELNAANGRIAELTTKTPPHECPQESVTTLCANHPNLAEYVAQMEKQIAGSKCLILTSERDNNQSLYHNSMEELRLTRRQLDEQRDLHHAAAAELAAVKEALWPDQTGLPNEHRNAALAIKAIKRLQTPTKPKIITRNDCPPIPDRSFDWSAVTDNYDLDYPIGHGATEAEAIADLKQQIEDNEEPTTSNE